MGIYMSHRVAHHLRGQTLPSPLVSYWDLSLVKVTTVTEELTVFINLVCFLLNILLFPDKSWVILLSSCVGYNTTMIHSDFSHIWLETCDKIDLFMLNQVFWIQIK